MTTPGNNPDNTPSDRLFDPDPQSSEELRREDARRVDDQADDMPTHAAPIVSNERRVAEAREMRHATVAREKEAFGGFKFGSAFFGWLAATGMALLLTALVAGTGTALALATDTTVDETADGAAANADTVGIIGAVILLLIILLSYFCGGYVAGRMARFSGLKQGLAVWLWAVVVAVVIAIVGAVGGGDFNILANLNGFPRIPVGEGDLTTIGVITALIVAAASLIGALLGGLAGMRYHRRVDRAGFDDGVAGTTSADGRNR
jgi:hypothetical protein